MLLQRFQWESFAPGHSCGLDGALFSVAVAVRDCHLEARARQCVTCFMFQEGHLTVIPTLTAHISPA